ncbi:MAG: nucleotidyltransferase domain-containing protein [Bacillota bacterium]|nr:nucleotidyltransferase domain-containing protein [Bacillota bacterium]
MSSLAEIRERIELRRRRLEEGLAVVLPQLADLGAVKVLLFGSLASATVDSDSDLDLLVIMPNTRTGKDWADTIYSEVDRRVETDFIVFNTDEYSLSLPHNSFLREISSSGRVVYERLG